MKPAIPIKIMVVDDSSVIRNILKKIIEKDSSLRLIGTASNGKEALSGLSSLKPDLVVLDIAMPVMDGFEALPKLLKINPSLKVIMLSGMTEGAAEVTLWALSNGAVDFIPKPTSANEGSGFSQIERELLEKIHLHGDTKVAPRPLSTVLRSAVPNKSNAGKHFPQAIAIGSSTGGPNALATLFSSLHQDVRQPVFVTQHMPPVFTKSLAKRIAECARRTAREAVDGETVREGIIYIAPGDYHMQVQNEGTALTIRLSQSEKVNFCRPSVDVMFQSLAKAYGGKTLAIVLTGMGEDGKRGAAEIGNQGGTVLIQDRESSVVWGMPGAIYEAGTMHGVFPIKELPAEMNRYCLTRIKS